MTWFQGATQVGAINQNPLNVCPSVTTTYTAIVKYTNPNGTTFSASKDVTVFVEPPLAVDDFSVSNVLKVYPNPTSDFVYVQTDANHLILKTVVSDITGQSVLILGGDCQKLNIDHLSDGIYFLKVITNKGVFQNKFIKTN